MAAQASPPPAGPAKGSGPPAYPPLAFGRYIVEREVGRGRNSVVYRAVDPQDQAVVALKIVFPSTEDSTLERRVAGVEREAERLRLLSHPNIVGVRNAGVEEGKAYIVFPFVKGNLLERVLASGVMPPAEGVALIIKVAQAVHHAHERGLIHRDLKPGNIIVGQDHEPYVLDYGLSWRTGDQPEAGVQSIVGTPAYMSPEQARGEETHLTFATDVYGIGAILYEILTGRPPFAGETPWKTVQLVMSALPVKPREINAKIDASYERVVLWCLEKDPGRRYSSTAALAADLRRVQQSQPPQGPTSTGTFFRRLFGSKS
jgi:eukaryotic-like serine/threonine-protein kinase